jgi:hypothetical protein
MASTRITEIDTTPKAKSPKRIKKADLLLKLKEYDLIQRKISKLYGDADSLRELLIVSMAVGDVHDLENGRKISLVDNFAKSNFTYRPKRFDRFELRIQESKKPREKSERKKLEPKTGRKGLRQKRGGEVQ